MDKKKAVLLFLAIIIIIPFAALTFGFTSQIFKDKKINDDFSKCLQNLKYSEPVSVTGVDVITQDVSCGYAVIEMFSSWNGGDITEEKLYDEYGKVVTSTGKSFCTEMNKRFPEYETVMYKYLSNSEMIDVIYNSLSNGMPVPIEWAAKMDEDWTLHYSLVVGMDIPGNTVTVANPYGYMETVSIEEFLSRTRFDAYENMPLFLKMGFAFDIFEKNTIFVIMEKENRNEDVEKLISDFKKETHCRSVSAVTYDNGEAVFYGDRDALFQIGSMTKAFTGLAVQKLVIEGKISYDDYVSDYADGFETYFDSKKTEITVRNLIEQKSGFTNSEKDYPSASEGMNLSEWAESISGKELKSLPGTEYAYSNVNYNLLGLIIEKVSGMTYKDYMENEILAPLGLKNTYVGMPESGRVKEGSRLGYRHAFDYYVPVKEAGIPAGYFYSNAEDMTRWMNIWTGSEDVPKEFAEAVKSIMQQLNEEGDYFSGWEYFENGTIGHSGGTPNYSSRMVFSDKEKTGVCVLCSLNVASSTDSLCNGIFDILSGQKQGKISHDVWTVFDIIFSSVTAIGTALAVFAVFNKNRIVLLISDIAVSILFALILILFPIIFSAGLKDILFVWGPLSMTVGILIMGLDIIVITLRLFVVKKYARNHKAG